MTENQKKALDVMNALYALEASSAPKTRSDMLIEEIALLRDAFFDAVPDARHDHRLGDMMGSPESVLHYVGEYLRSLPRAQP